MEQIRLQDAAAALGLPCTEDTEIMSITTDTRKIEAGSLFVALVGERFDGHDFVEAALDNGAVAAVVSRPVENVPQEKLLMVADTRRALMELAGLYRTHFQIPVVGVTGSVGKTSTKEMIYAVLNDAVPTLKTAENLNNEIGLSQTLFGLDRHFGAAVIEMGMYNAGEIRVMTKVTRPTVAVITNIGVSHIVNLGSRENILKAKLEIAEGLPEGGTLILNKDNDLLGPLTEEEVGHPLLTYGIEESSADIVGKDLVVKEGKTYFTICYKGQEHKAMVPCLGQYNVGNALCAFGVAAVLGFDLSKAAAALSHFQNTGMRQHLVRNRGITFVEDCYNASPDSMKAALDALEVMEVKGHKLALLGDMLELGNIEAISHKQVGAYAATKGLYALYTYGVRAMDIAKLAKQGGMTRVYSFTDKEELAEALRKELCAGDALLCKASRGMALEEVLKKLYEEC